MDLCLEAAVIQPRGNVLAMGLGVFGAHVGVADDEADPGEALGDGEERVGERVALVGGQVVLGDLAAGDDAAELVEAVEGALQLLAADVVVEDVDALAARQAGQDLGRRPLLRLVVPPAVEAELLGDELELLVRAHAAQHRQPFVLGQLAHQLPDGARGAADEDGLALLGLADLVERRIRRQARHAQRAEEVADVLGGVGLVDLGGQGALVVARHDIIFLDGQAAGDDVALGITVHSRFQDFGQGAGLEWTADGERWRVGLDLGVAQQASHIRVEGDVEGFQQQAVGRQLLVQVDLVHVFDLQMLAHHGEVRGDLLEDQGLVSGRHRFLGLMRNRILD